MGIVLDDDFVVAAIDGNFHRPRGLRRSLVLINLDAVALKGGEEIVDFFGGMDLCRKRIVYFVVEQVAPLFAHGNELPYCIIFFFKAYCCHKFLPITCRNSRHSPDRPESAFRIDTHRLARRRKPRGSFPRRFLAFLFENLCTAPLVCRRPRALPASRTFGARPLPLNTVI